MATTSSTNTQNTTTTTNDLDLDFDRSFTTTTSSFSSSFSDISRSSLSLHPLPHHALGFVYRDLKPENVLLRDDGHVMLSDFDLSFHSHVSPFLSKDEKGGLEFVAESRSAASRAAVGTHEYLAPEIVSGAIHGSGVDWWAFGVFVYELLYGRTPFKGGSKEATLKNILLGEVRFPEGGGVEARDLVSRLLERDVGRRMGSEKGAAEIKKHGFFEGVNWALIRMTKPPAVAGFGGMGARKKRVEREGKRWWSWRWNRW